jgi:hypothetical protein
MLKLSGNLINIPVISLRTGRRIAIAEQPIVNPHNLKIIGWWCKTNKADGLKVLLTEDVRDSLGKGMAVNDEDALSDPEDLVRHKETLKVKFQLIEKTVKTKRQKIGKIQDYSYNDGMFVQKLYVERSLIKVFSKEDIVIVDRTQILEVTDNYILVRDTEVKAIEDDMATAALPA